MVAGTVVGFTDRGRHLIPNLGRPRVAKPFQVLSAPGHCRRHVNRKPEEKNPWSRGGCEGMGNRRGQALFVVTP